MTFKVGDRVKFKDNDFLSNGSIKKVISVHFSTAAYIVKLDKKAPNEYAWITDEVLAWPTDLEKE